MSSSFSVQYIFTLQDRFSAQARALSRVAQGMAKPIQAAGRAANAAAQGVARYGAAAAKAASQVNALAKTKIGAMLHGGRQGRGMGVGAAFGSLGIGLWGRTVLNEAREASKAENKFRSLIDNETDAQMQRLRADITAQMQLTGESFGELLDAAGDAAQMVGNADLARTITIAASKLAKIDTAGKSTADFAEAIASIVGPNGTFEQVTKVADMLAKQQKLGAATAGGTMEAFKNVIGFSQMVRADTTALLATIGIIKNISPALEDSNIGNMATYGIRMMTMPTGADLKKLKAAGFNPKDFLDVQGNFDLLKTHEKLYALMQSKGGLDKIKELFAGRNKLAGQYWLNLLQRTPQQLKEYFDALNASAETLDSSFDERLKGLEGSMNRLEGAGKFAAISLGMFLAPAIETFADYASDAANGLAEFLKTFQETNPELAHIAGIALTGAAAMAAFALPLAAVTWALRTLGAGAALRGIAGLAGLLGRVALGVGGGMLAGLAAGAGKMGRAMQLAFRFAGALGAAKIAARALGSALKFTVLITGAVWVFENWDKIRASFENPMKVDIIWPEAPAWFKWIMNSGGIERGRDATRAAREDVDAIKGWFGRQWDWITGAEPQVPGSGGPNAAAVPQSEGQKEMSIRTTLDPITITTPPSIDVNVNVRGQVNGPVSGSGTSSLPIGANAPRGKSTAAPAAPVSP